MRTRALPSRIGVQRPPIYRRHAARLSTYFHWDAGLKGSSENLMGYIGLYLLIELAICAGLLVFLGRSVCLTLGFIGLALGVGAPLAIWGYASMFVQSDPSAYGMLGTILAILFEPGGLVLTALSMFKRRSKSPLQE